MTLRDEILAHTTVGEEFSVPELVDRIYPGVEYWERMSKINSIAAKIKDLSLPPWRIITKVGKARREDGRDITMWRREE